MLKVKTTFDMGDVVQRLKDAKENTLEYIDAELLLNFYAITTTWEHEVRFVVEKSNGRHAVGTNDERFEKLNNGFKRHVTLSEDFERKSQPRILAAFPGAGFVVGFTPFGIEVPAGEWDEANAEEVEPLAGPIAQQEYGKLFK